MYETGKKLAKGDVITVKYYGKNIYGTLLEPVFYRVRDDVVWNEVLEDQNKQ
jgi:hypothetical protein